MSHHFISFDPADRDFALALTKQMEKGLPKLSLWITELHLSGSMDLREEIRDAIRTASSFILITSNQLRNETCRCHWEWKKALSFQKPVLLVPLEQYTFIPAKLETRRSFLVHRGQEAELNRLRQTLQSIGSNENTLITLKEYLADAQFDRAYALDQTDLSNIQRDIDDLQAQITTLQSNIDNPSGNETRIDLGIEREKRKLVPEEVHAGLKFINDPPALAPPYFQDRHLETSLLIGFIKSVSEKMAIVDGRGGVGKTAMVCRFLKALEQEETPDSGEPLTVDGIIYMNAIGSHQINLADILNHISKLLDENSRREMDEILRGTGYTVKSKTCKLLDKIRGKTVILLLDNFEDELTGANQIQKPELAEFFETIISYPAAPLKILITTRHVPSELAELPPDKMRSITLEAGLPPQYAELALREMDADGRARLKNASIELLNSITDFTRGYPRALEAFYSILRADRNTSVEEILQRVYPADKVTLALVGEAYSRLSLAEQRVMEALAVFGFPVSAIAIDHLLSGFNLQLDSSFSLRRLVNMHFVRKEGREYFLHPLDREYALNRLPEDDPPRNTEELEFDFNSYQDIEISYEPTLSAMRRRAADYLAQLRKPAAEWNTIKDVEPQLREFELRIQAGDIYGAEILLEDLSIFLDNHGGFTQLFQMSELLEKHADNYYSTKLALTTLFNAFWRQGNDKKTLETGDRLIAFLENNNGKKSDLYYARINLMIVKMEIKATEEKIREFQQYIELPENQVYLNDSNKIVTYQQVAMAYRTIGFCHEAFSYGQQALDLALKGKDLNSIEAEKHNLGTCYADLNNLEKAIELYTDAMRLSEKTNNPLWKANHLASLSNCYCTIGNLEKARELTDASLKLKKEIGDRAGESGHYARVAKINYHAMQYKQAMDFVKMSIAIGQDLGRSMLHQYTTAALIHLMDNQFNQGLEDIDAALKEEATGALYQTNLYKGLLHYRTGNVRSAKQAFSDCINEASEFIRRCDLNAEAYTAKALATIGEQLCVKTKIPDIVLSEALELYRKAYECRPYQSFIREARDLFDKLTENIKEQDLDKITIRTTIDPTYIPPKTDITPQPPRRRLIRKKILFISSSPREMSQPNVEEQYAAISRSEKTGKIKIKVIRKSLVDPEDLLDVITSCKPDIVHFFTHNSKIRGLYFENSMKRLVPVKPETIGRIFMIAQRECQIECVVMNCCNSVTLLDSLKPAIKNIVYAQDYVPDDKESVASLFAEKFYAALADGKSYSEALEKTRIALEAAAPVLPPENVVAVADLFKIYCA